MSKALVTYRTAGSAALKADYSFKQDKPTPIIDFDQLVDSKSRIQTPEKTRLLSLLENAVEAIHSDPLLGSIDKAFLKQGAVSKSSSETYIRSVAGVSLVFLFLILVGA